MNPNRMTIGVRAVSAGLLLVLLGVCGYAGAKKPEAKTASVPVERGVMAQEAYASQTIEQTRQRLEARRKEEIALLDTVLAENGVSEENRQSALAQKTQIAGRMETEAQIEASLAYMGYDRAAVVCGAQSVSVFIPYDQAGDEQSRIRLIDAAASASGLLPEAVKIILVKK